MKLQGTGGMMCEAGERPSGEAYQRVILMARTVEGAVGKWNLLLGLRCGVTQGHASLTILTQCEF